MSSAGHCLLVCFWSPALLLFDPPLCTAPSCPQGPVGVHEGHAFIVEAAVSVGGKNIKPGLNIHRFANRIPLLFEVWGLVWAAVRQARQATGFRLASWCQLPACKRLECWHMWLAHVLQSMRTPFRRLLLSAHDVAHATCHVPMPAAGRV